MNWSARYFKVKNQDGEEVVIDRWDARSRYNKLARAFVQHAKHEGLLYYKHITLTQKEESYKPRILHPFLMALKKRYGRIAYIWTVEVQEERKEKYGVSVLHWHLVVAFEPDVSFGREDIEKIQSYWSYGNVDIRPVRKLNLDYVLKYVQKSLDTPLIEYQGMRVRKIGMSRISQLYRHAKENIHKIMNWFEGRFHEMGEFFKVDKKGVYYEWYDSWFDRWRRDYALVVNAWQIVDAYDESPF